MHKEEEEEEEDLSRSSCILFKEERRLIKVRTYVRNAITKAVPDAGGVLLLLFPE